MCFSVHIIKKVLALIWGQSVKDSPMPEDPTQPERQEPAPVDPESKEEQEWERIKPDMEKPSIICPVCKSSTYLDRKKKFLVNTKCYHIQCDACIKRIYEQGPAPCPIAGCEEILRLKDFKEPRFEDLAIEREVDIRAYVDKILNHQEADFESLRAFNDYQEWKEDIVFKLVSKKDVEETEQQLQIYAKENFDAIAINKQLEQERKETNAYNAKIQKERSELGLAETLREIQKEKALRQAEEREIVNRIANSSEDATKVAREAEAEVMRRAAARAQAARVGTGAAKRTTTAAAVGVGNGLKRKGDKLPPSSLKAKVAKVSAEEPQTQLSESFKVVGLKKREKPVPEDEAKPVAPYDPFGGYEMRPLYYTLKETGNYDHPWSNGVDTDPKQNVGGLRAFDYQRRAIFEAHAGLGVIIADEKMDAAGGQATGE